MNSFQTFDFCLFPFLFIFFLELRYFILHLKAIVKFIFLSIIS